MQGIFHISADEVYTRLSKFIEDAHVEFRRVANCEMGILFWQIGNLLNTKSLDSEIFKKNGENQKNELEKRYGHYLQNSSLECMQKFASQFTDETEATLVTSVSDWEHIKQLARIKDPIARRNLLCLMVQQKLSIDELENEINKISEEIIPEVKKRKNKNHLRICALALEDQRRVNPLQENILSGLSFIWFSELFNKQPGVSLAKKNTNTFEVKFTEKISSIIDERTAAFTRWLAVHLPITCWKIGIQLNQNFEDSSSIFKNFHTYLENFSLFLEKDSHISIPLTFLKTLSDFAREVKTIELAMYISHRCNWNQLIQLLALKGIERKVFYAKLIGLNKLNELALKIQIDNNLYEQVSEAESDVNQLIHSLHQSSSSTRRLDNIEIITVYIDEYDGEVYPNQSFGNLVNTPYFQILRQ